MADITLPEEEWRPIVGHPFYEVSNLGRVRSQSRIITEKSGKRRLLCGRILKQHPGGENKLHMFVGLGSLCPSTQVHILVCRAFHGPKPSLKHEVAHWDGNGHNNVYTNLRWATRKQNIEDAKRHGTIRQGINHSRPGSKLKEADIHKIRRLISAGVPDQKIADQFTVHRRTIVDIRLHKTWVWLVIPRYPSL